MNLYEQIKASMPYGENFLFVDTFTHLDEEGAEGTYTFREDEFFYSDHFPDFPITPGVILIECMAQIGLIGLGFFLTEMYKKEEIIRVAFASSEVNFLKPVYPGEQVWVRSKKIYFRFGKLKCEVEMENKKGETVCRGNLSGMLLKPGHYGR